MTTYSLPLHKDIISSKRASAAIGVVFFILATMLGAYVRIPVAGSPVPITLQTFFALLAGAVLGKRLGSASQIGYIMLGVAGIPYLFGPTGGYIIGFVIASYAVGLLTHSGRPAMGRLIASFAAGSAIILACGALWLMAAYKMGAGQAFSAGVLPFIPGDAAKALLAAVVYSRIAGRTSQIFRA